MEKFVSIEGASGEESHYGLVLGRDKVDDFFRRE
jgi:hypothetical protein